MQIIRTSKDILIVHSLEATPARVKILAACIASQTPQAVADVARVIGDKAHLATVYRTLELLVKATILTRVDFQEGKFRYEYVKDHHHHAVCDRCGRVAEIQDKNLENLMDNINVENGFSITRHALELFGICQGCQKKGINVN